MKSNKIIGSLDELADIIRRAKRIKFYGAGLRLLSFMEMTEQIGIQFQAECILVSSSKGNPDTAYGIPVVEVSKASFQKGDIILLTMSENFVEDAVKKLSDYGVTENVYKIDYTIVDGIPYRKVNESIESFLKIYPDLQSEYNMPAETERRHVWTSWWQGEDSAPLLVKKCLESQRENLPEQTEHVVITWENYRNYIELPEYIVEKAKSGKIKPAHLADIARCCLLYRYGGIWLDSTVYLLDKLPEECFEYDIMTRSTGEKIYCTNVSWVTWFLGGRKEEALYRFIMEAFFAYLKSNDEISNYYMIDFLIAIACRELEGIEEKLKKVPINNINATQLQKHLHEAFDEKSFFTYTEGGYLQKLTYKESGYSENSIYSYLVGSDL